MSDYQSYSSDFSPATGGATTADFESCSFNFSAATYANTAAGHPNFLATQQQVSVHLEDGVGELRLETGAVLTNAQDLVALADDEPEEAELVEPEIDTQEIGNNIDSGNYEAAEQRCRAILIDHPDEYVVHFLLGLSLTLAYEEYEEAYRHPDSRNFIQSNDGVFPHQRTGESLHLDDYEDTSPYEGLLCEAIARFEDAARLCRGNACYYHWLGHAWYLLKDYEESRGYFELADAIYELDGLNTPPEIFYELGMVEYHLGDNDKALNSFDKAQNEGYGKALYGKGLVFVSQQDLENGITCLQECVQELLHTGQDPIVLQQALELLEDLQA